MSKRFLDENDKVLIVDDFLAIGNALNGLIALVNDSGASLAGCGVVIEKGFSTAAINSGATVLRLNLLLLLKVWTMKQARFISEINRFLFWLFGVITL